MKTFAILIDAMRASQSQSWVQPTTPQQPMIFRNWLVKSANTLC